MCIKEQHEGIPNHFDRFSKISSVDYQFNTGIFTITGNNFVRVMGSNNDVDIQKFTIGGQAATSTKLPSTVNVDVSKSTQITSTAIAADKIIVNCIQTCLLGSLCYGATSAVNQASTVFFPFLNMV